MRFELLNGKCHDQAGEYQRGNEQNHGHSEQGEGHLAGRIAQFNGTLRGDDLGTFGHG